MTHAEEPFGVGVIGCSATSRFVCERLSLRSDLRLAAAWIERDEEDELPSALAGISSLACRRHTTPFEVIDDPHVRVLYFADGSNADWMQLALGTAKPIVVESPQSLSPGELERLERDAAGLKQVAAVYAPRRWETDFLQARSALDSGHLGRLLRVRYLVHDYRLPNETYPRGVATDLGSHVLDQLLLLTGASPCRPPEIRHFPSKSDRSDGFVCCCDFADDLSANIEIQTRSLLSYRSGWMLEGTTGAYRNGRLYTQTADGEIIDEPLPAPSLSSDPFFDALSLALRGTTSELPTIQDAARVAALLANLDVETK
ncbi:MAG: hypothetical protein AABP62_04730 [Planctomycetota bacterium]